MQNRDSDLPHLAYIALGSNLAGPIQQVTQAIQAIAALSETQLLKQSSLYQSRPYGPVAQPDFINAVVEIATYLDPEILLNKLQLIEKQQDRKRTIHWGPRTIDLDILLYAEKEINTENLTIPHAELKMRNFVLYPLAEIAPSLILPCGTTINHLLMNINNEGIERI